MTIKLDPFAGLGGKPEEPFILDKPFVYVPPKSHERDPFAGLGGTPLVVGGGHSPAAVRSGPVASEHDPFAGLGDRTERTFVFDRPFIHERDSGANSPRKLDPFAGLGGKPEEPFILDATGPAGKRAGFEHAESESPFTKGAAASQPTTAKRGFKVNKLLSNDRVRISLGRHEWTVDTEWAMDMQELGILTF